MVCVFLSDFFDRWRFSYRHNSTQRVTSSSFKIHRWFINGCGGLVVVFWWNDYFERCWRPRQVMQINKPDERNFPLFTQSPLIQWSINLVAEESLKRVSHKFQRSLEEESQRISTRHPIEFLTSSRESWRISTSKTMKNSEEGRS